MEITITTGVVIIKIKIKIITMEKKIIIIRIIRVVVEVIIIITTRNGLKTRNRLKLIGIIDTVGRMAKMNTKVRKVVAQEITE